MFKNRCVGRNIGMSDKVIEYLALLFAIVVFGIILGGLFTGGMWLFGLIPAGFKWLFLVPVVLVFPLFLMD